MAGMFLVTGGWTILRLGLILSGAVTLTPQLKALFERVTALEYAVILGVAGAKVAGAVLLFFMRRAAFWTFLAVFLFGLTMVFWHGLVDGAFAAADARTLLNVAASQAMFAGICGYLGYLVKKGVLI
ncbi:MAG: hypothetical protein WC969_04740 [Elusimicrobiota bacterium]